MESIHDEIDLLRKLTKCLAEHWGSNCEVVLHDLKNKKYNKSICAIENGHITGRKIGGIGTNLGLEVMRGSDINGDKVGYITHTDDGKILRSTSIYIRNKKNEVIGALCINYDISSLVQAEKSIAILTNSNYEFNGNGQVREYFANDVDELLQKLILESISDIEKSVVNMTKEDKIRAISYLDRKGAFLIKKSVEKVARYFMISRYTIYNYLDESRLNEQNGEKTFTSRTIESGDRGA